MKKNIWNLCFYTCYTLAIFGLLLVTLLSIGGFFPNLDWRLGWYSHPRPHFLLLSLLAAGWFLFSSNKLMVFASIIPIVINGIVLAPFFFAPSQSFPESAETLSVLHLNTNKGAADLATIREFGADIVFLQEATPALMATLEEKLPKYRVEFSHPLTNTHGSALLVHADAEIEISIPEIHHLPADNVRPLMSAQTKLGDTDLTLLSMHAIRPHHPHADFYQQIEYDAVADWASREIDAGNELLIIGDFNATPWSVRFKSFLDESQTRDTMLGHGLQNSWSPAAPMWVGLPIDHATVSTNLVVVDRQTRPVLNSDHGLLFVQIGITP